MSALMPFLALNQTCNQVQAWVHEQLTSAGFRVVQTFDLQVARLAHSGCPCPHHGTEDCNCQMVVLLVYRKRNAPATLVLHGQDGRTWPSLANQARQRADPRLEGAIRRTLIPPHPDPLSSVGAAYETRSAV